MFAFQKLSKGFQPFKGWRDMTRLPSRCLKITEKVAFNIASSDLKSSSHRDEIANSQILLRAFQKMTWLDFQVGFAKFAKPTLAFADG